jgi:hypothetical protein
VAEKPDLTSISGILLQRNAADHRNQHYLMPRYSPTFVTVLLELHGKTHPRRKREYS